MLQRALDEVHHLRKKVITLEDDRESAMNHIDELEVQVSTLRATNRREVMMVKLENSGFQLASSKCFIR